MTKHGGLSFAEAQAAFAQVDALYELVQECGAESVAIAFATVLQEAGRVDLAQALVDTLAKAKASSNRRGRGYQTRQRRRLAGRAAL